MSLRILEGNMLKATMKISIRKMEYKKLIKIHTTKKEPYWRIIKNFLDKKGENNAKNKN